MSHVVTLAAEAIVPVGRAKMQFQRREFKGEASTFELPGKHWKNALSSF